MNNKVQQEIQQEVNMCVKKIGFLKMAHKLTKKTIYGFDAPLGEKTKGLYKGTFGLVCKELSNITKNFDIMDGYHRELACEIIEDLVFGEEYPEEYEKYTNGGGAKLAEIYKEIDNIDLNPSDDNDILIWTMLLVNRIGSPIEDKREYRLFQLGLHPDKYQFKNECMREMYFQEIESREEVIKMRERGEI